jgi:hypothetical protein
MKKFYTYVTKPYVISILPAIIIIIQVPLDRYRYTLKLDSYIRSKDHTYNWCDDLDMDGSSEMSLALETDNKASINIFKESVHLNQWSFKGTYNLSCRP